MARRTQAKELFTASEVARFCQVDLKTIHNWADRGEIRHFRTPGRHLRFRRVDVLDFLRKEKKLSEIIQRTETKNFCYVSAGNIAANPSEMLLAQKNFKSLVEEAGQIFAPGSGSFAQFYNTTLRALVVQQGSQFVPAPGSTVKISPSFLAFLNSAQSISSTLYASGGNQPSLDFTLTEVKSAGVSDAVLNIDGKQIKSGGES